MKTIHVLGTGESLKRFKPDGNITIGVNNIWQYHPTDYLVSTDVPKRTFNHRSVIEALGFAPKVDSLQDWLYLEKKYPVLKYSRMHHMINSKPIKFFSISPEWSKFHDKVEVIKTPPVNNDLSKLHLKQLVPVSNNSTFVAAVMAYFLGADEIILWGVDFKNHAQLGEQLVKNTAVRDFRLLFQKLLELKCKLCMYPCGSALDGLIGQPTSIPK